MAWDWETYRSALRNAVHLADALAWLVGNEGDDERLPDDARTVREEWALLLAVMPEVLARLPRETDDG